MLSNKVIKSIKKKWHPETVKMWLIAYEEMEMPEEKRPYWKITSYTLETPDDLSTKDNK